MRSVWITFLFLLPAAPAAPASAQPAAPEITQRQHDAAEAGILQSVLRARQPRPDSTRFRDVRRVVVLALPTREAPLYGYCGEVTSKDELGFYRNWQPFFAWTAQLGSTPHVTQTDAAAPNAPFDTYCRDRSGVAIRFGAPLPAGRTPVPFDLDAATLGSMLAGSFLITALGGLLFAAFRTAERGSNRCRPIPTRGALDSRPAVNLRAEDLLADEDWPTRPKPRPTFKIDRQWRRWPGRGGSDRLP